MVTRSLPKGTTFPLNPSEMPIPSDMQVLELDAERAESELLDVRVKLSELLPIIRRINALFVTNKRNSITFRGCKSFFEYCERRLHCTAKAFYMMEKRLRLGNAAKEAAKEAERERRRERKWTQQAEKLMCDTEFQRARNDRWVKQMAQGQHDYEQAVEAGIVEDEAEEILHFPDTDGIIRSFLALSDEDVAAFDQIIVAADSLAPHLVEAIKALRGKHMRLARDVRDDLDIRVGGGNVVSIGDHQ